MNSHRSRHPSVPSLLAAATIFAVTSSGFADVWLPHVFGENMVLQRQMEVPVWGKAEPGEKVAVSFAGQTIEGVADAEGRWMVRLRPMEANAEPATFVVAGTNTITLGNVLVGEVWLCSGQSNMEWTVSGSNDAAEEIAAATDGLIRHLKMPHAPSAVPVEDRETGWQINAPETAGNFTACGYFFARELRRALGVPVGLLNSSWGGTRIEPWTPAEGFEGIPALEDIRQRVAMANPASPAHKEALKAHLDAVETWLAEARKASEAGALPAPQPGFPTGLRPITEGGEPHQQPTTLYNGMLQPLVPFAIRGTLWYQGESNHGEGKLYTEKTRALLKGWRAAWGQPELPYYFVQIAPFEYGTEQPEILAEFWEAQDRILEIPHTGMVVINDIGNLKDIHPKNKQEVGRRLALLALAKTYGKSEVVSSGPRFRELKPEGNKLRVVFDSVGGGLVSRDGQPLTHFEVLGADTGFVPATAEIAGPDSLLLSAEGVEAPVSVRYAWHKLAEPNLMNKEGLPAVPFRAGEILVPDLLNQHVPEAGEYEVVYDLDLSKLGGGEVAYDVNRAAELKGKGFDRVAYMLELQKGGERPSFAFAAMDAFTDDLEQIGLPGEVPFQQAVSRLTVRSNVEGVVPGDNLEGGNIEFWTDNYGPGNSANVPGASSVDYDFGDMPSEPKKGYGSMQVHNGGARQTVMALNKWNAGPTADVGIGNQDGPNKDWTFASNAGAYSYKRLRVLVRLAKP